MMNSENLYSLLPTLYAAPLDDTKWTEFLDAFRSKVGASQALLSLVDLAGAGVRSRVSMSGIAPEVVGEYMAKWVTQDPWVQRSPRVAPLGDVRCSHELCPDEELEPLPIYQEFLSKQGWHYGAGVIVATDNGLHGVLSFSRPKTSGPVNEEEKALLQALQPHVTACVALTLRLRELEAQVPPPAQDC